MPRIFLNILCLLVFIVVVGACSSNTTSLAPTTSRSYYGIPFFSGTLDRDVYAAIVQSDDVYNDYQCSKAVTPEYIVIKRHAVQQYVFNVYLNQYERKLLIAFRGSSEANDWLDNANLFKSYYQVTSNFQLLFHTGFLNEFLSYEYELMNILQQYRNYYIIWTGHSQGGALAQIASVVLGFKLSIPFSNSILITFGAPAAGDYQFSLFAPTIIPHKRIVNADPCYVFNCFDADYVSSSLELFDYYHFGNLIPFETDYGAMERHYRINYLAEVKKRVMNYNLVLMNIYYYASRIYYNLYQVDRCSLLELTISNNNGTIVWKNYLPCTFDGSLNANFLSTGVYDLSGSISGLPILTFPPQVTISTTFDCPSECSECDTETKQCTSCLNGYYGSLCQYQCSPYCLSCNGSSTSCTSCYYSGSNPPTCAPTCNNGCVNGHCENTRCICNSGYTGLNCSNIVCPNSNCLKCSSPSLCTQCIPGTFGVNCTITCPQNCLSCTNSTFCSKCNSGYSGATCLTGPSYASSIDYLRYNSNNNTFSLEILNAPFKVSKVYKSNENYYCGIGFNGNSFIFTFLYNEKSLTTVYNNQSFAPFTSIACSERVKKGFLATTNYPGIIIGSGDLKSIPKSNTSEINTGINEVFIDVQMTPYFSYYLTRSGEVRVYGDCTDAELTWCGSGFEGVTAISNFTKLALPHKISLLKCEAVNSFICFAYSKESRKLYGWGTITAYYYGGSSDTTHEPILLDTSRFGNDVISFISIGSGSCFFVTESGRVFGCMSTTPLANIPTNETIIRASIEIASTILTTVTMKNYVSYYYCYARYPSNADCATKAVLWPNSNQFIGYLSYESISCYGKFDFDPSVCSGNGVCKDSNICQCNSEYTGEFCQIPICYGKRADVSTVCSGVGTCISSNNCSCPQGYSGQNCESYWVTSNCLPSASNCQSCSNGYYDTSTGCLYKCLVNCEQCSSSGECDKCIDGMTGEFCNERVCKAVNCLDCSKKSGLCVECIEGYYGDYCNQTCPSKCKKCSSSIECTSCQSGWFGNQCEFPVCQEHCLRCSSPSICSRCFDGMFGPNCTDRCMSSCQTCDNFYSCLTCPPYSNGTQCEIQEENCLLRYNSPKVSVSSSSMTSDLIYTISIPTILQQSAVRFSFSAIEDCNSASTVINGTELTFNSTRKLSCETEYVFISSAERLLRNSRVLKDLDSTGVVLTLSVPIYVAILSNTEGCFVTNYQINHQIKLLLSSHQYIDLGVQNPNITTSISFRKELITVSDKKLLLSGILYTQNSTLESITYDGSQPFHNVSFDFNIIPSSSGVYIVKLSAKEIISYYSGVFNFNVILRGLDENIHQLTLSISIYYYMPIDPPTTELTLFSQLTLYTENFKSTKNLYQISEKPHVFINLVDSKGKSSSLQDSLKFSLKNAYMCCVNSGQSMPVFNLQNQLYGCTRNNPSIMTYWFHLIQNKTEIQQYESTIIQFPFVNNQIAFSFKLTSEMFANSAFGSISNCFIHTETILESAGQSKRSIIQQASSVEKIYYYAYDIIQILNNQTELNNPIQPKQSTLTENSFNVLNGSSSLLGVLYLVVITCWFILN